MLHLQRTVGNKALLDLLGKAGNSSRASRTTDDAREIVLGPLGTAPDVAESQVHTGENAGAPAVEGASTPSTRHGAVAPSLATPVRGGVGDNDGVGQVVAGVRQRLPGSAAVQRQDGDGSGASGNKKPGLVGLLVDPRGPKSPFDMPEAEKEAKYKAVLPEILKAVDRKDELVKGGLSQEQAEFQIYDRAPDELKPFLPLHDSFDRLKREVDRIRAEEGGQAHGEISYLMQERAKKYGYQMGSAVSVELKPKDIAKELAETKAEERAFEREAIKRLLARRAVAETRLDAAKDGSEKEKADAKAGMDGLLSSEAVEQEVLKLKLELLAVIQEKVGEAEAKYLFGKGEPPGQGKLWAKKRKIAKEVRDDFLKSPDKYLVKAEAVSSFLKPLPTVVKPVTLLGSQLNEMMKAVGYGVSGFSATFTGTVRIIGLIQQIRGHRDDEDTRTELAAEIANTLASMNKAASKTITALDKAAVLGAAAPAAQMAPIIGVVGNVLALVGSVVSLTLPLERYRTTISAMKKTNDEALRLAFERTLLENQLQLGTEIVTIAAEVVILVANVSELAAAGGMGAPAGIKVVGLAAIQSKKAYDAAVKEWQAIKTTNARKEALAQKEGTGKKLIGTDIAYAVDAIIAKAKGTPPDLNAVEVLATYGMLPAEVGHYSFDVIRAKVFDKLETDTDQKTLYKKAKTTLSDLKTALDFGEDKEGEYQTIEEGLRNPKKKKGALDKLAAVPKKIGSAPSDIKHGIGEKWEKSTRLVEAKNLAGAAGETERGTVSKFIHFLKDEEGIKKSELKLREYIVDAVRDEGKKKVLLNELQTVEEKKKSDATVRRQRERLERETTGKVKDRVITPGFAEKVATMSLEELRALDKPGDTSADSQLVRTEIAKREGKDVSDTFTVKERKTKVKDPNFTMRLETIIANVGNPEVRKEVKENLGDKYARVVEGLSNAAKQTGRAVVAGGEWAGGKATDAAKLAKEKASEAVQAGEEKARDALEYGEEKVAGVNTEIRSAASHVKGLVANLKM